MLNIDRIEEAKLFFREAHDSIKQVRKFTGEPYWFHTEHVSSIISEVSGDENLIIAGLGHDTLEDVFPVNPDYNPELIEKKFGSDVLGLIVELTNVYTKDKYPQFNRAERHRLENERLMKISNRGKTAKLADVISNCGNLKDMGGFGHKYRQEKLVEIHFLHGGNQILWDRAKTILDKPIE